MSKSEVPNAGSDLPLFDLPPFDLTHFTAYRVALAAQLLSEALARRYGRFGISVPEWRVLAHLAHAGGVSVRDIQDAVVMEKSKVSRTAARLEARGLIAKAPQAEDKRLVHLSLTAQGRAMMAEILPLAAEFQQRLESELGGQFMALERGLERIIGQYGPSGEEVDVES